MKTKILSIVFILSISLNFSQIKTLAQDIVSVESIVERIKTEKIHFSEFLKSNTLDKKRERIYEYSNSINFNGRGRNIFFFPDSSAINDGKITYIAKESNNDVFKLTAVFDEVTSVDEKAFNYTFKFVKNENASIYFHELNSQERIKIGNKVFFIGRDRIEVTDLLEKKLLKTKYYKKEIEKNSINFSTEEVEFLSKKGNLDQLKLKLKEQNLL